MSFNPHYQQRESVRRLIVLARASIAGNEFDSARRNLERALEQHPDEDQRATIHYWLAQIAQTDEKRRDHLEAVLGINPSDGRARREIAILDGRLQAEEIVDPDHLPTIEAGDPQEAESRRFECPNCGQRMVYTPDGSSLLCEHCGYRPGMAADDSIDEADFAIGIARLEGHHKPVSMRAFECRACGAKYLLAPSALNLTCAHCDSVYTLEHAEAQDLIPPEAVVPFALSPEEAAAALKSWLKDHDLGNPFVESVQGVYLPVWTFDISGFLRWFGEVYNPNTEKWETVDGSQIALYDDLPVPASEPLPAGYGKLLDGYDLTAQKAFKPEYIANWLAESYKVIMSDAAVDGRASALKHSQARVRQELRGIRDLRFDTTGLMIETFKLILIPLYIAHYRFEKNLYEASISGQTGQTEGQLPPTRLQRFANWLRGG